jgi:hypothetical protein
MWLGPRHRRHVPQLEVQPLGRRSAAAAEVAAAAAAAAESAHAHHGCSCAGRYSQGLGLGWVCRGYHPSQWDSNARLRCHVPVGLGGVPMGVNMATFNFGLGGAEGRLARRSVLTHTQTRALSLTEAGYPSPCDDPAAGLTRRKRR